MHVEEQQSNAQLFYANFPPSLTKWNDNKLRVTKELKTVIDKNTSSWVVF